MSQSFIWFLIDEGILKHFHLYPLFNTTPLYKGTLMVMNHIHPHILLLLGLLL